MPDESKAPRRRLINRLSQRHIFSLGPGWHGDGAGLYLRIQGGGARSWVLVDTKGGKRKERGLGSALTVTLTQAREKRDRVCRGPAPSFGDFASTFIADHKTGWKNAKHREQWRYTVNVLARLLADKPLDAIGTGDVLAVLRPIWHKTPTTAARLRGRIERILSAARALGHRSGDNPAAWRGHLEFLLPHHRPAKTHMKAMPFKDVPALMKRLRGLTSYSVRALELTTLCATRTMETLGAKVREFDLDAAEWTIPEDRMKMGVEHTVPLSPRAVAIVRSLADDRAPGAFVFAGAKPDTHLSNMSMTMCLRGIDDNGYTVHGMRSAFRDWAGEMTEHPREVAEMALAHLVGDAVERAYRRGTALKKRRALMEDWERYCTGDRR